MRKTVVGENNTFFKFMKDIIDSGIWAKLSSAAKALYPVLCQFTNENFKPVWPGTETLLRLTGFKTKKSLQLAKRELVQVGLIDFIPGSGRTHSRYYFRFEYANSKVSLPRDTRVTSTGVSFSPPGEEIFPPKGDATISPNQIHININNNSDKQTTLLTELKELLENFVKNGSNQVSLKDQIVKNVIGRYGQLETGEAIKIAISRGKDGDLRYLEGILRNRKKDKDRKNKPGEADIQQKLIELANDEKIGKHIPQLKLQYKYNDTYYFIAKEPLPSDLITDILEGHGFKCKIFCRMKNEVHPLSLSV